jgi:hypothetical protein
MLLSLLLLLLLLLLSLLLLLLLEVSGPTSCASRVNLNAMSASLGMKGTHIA